MKKLIVIAVITAVLSGAVYAQELRFSGYLNSGVGFSFNDVEDDNPRVTIRANDADQNGLRFRLNGQYQNEDRTAGLRFRFQNQGGSSTPTVSHAWGWVNLFNSKVQLNAGRIEEGTWSTGDWWLSADSVSWFAGNGGLLKLMPIENLTLGAGIYVSSRDTSNYSMDLEDARITAHLGYTMPDVFRINFSYRTEADNTSVTTAGQGLTGQGGTSSAFYADLRILAVSGLTAVAAARFDKLEDFSEEGEIIFSETFAYKVNDELNIGLNAVQFLFMEDNADMGMLFNPWVSYALGSVVPRLDAVVFLGGRSNFIGTGGGLHRSWNHGGGAMIAAKDSDHMLINVRPSVAINADSRTRLEIGNSLYIDTYGGTPESGVTSNVFYIDLRWSF